MENIIDDHVYFGVLSFDIEKGEGEDDSYDRPIEKLKAFGWAEVGFKVVRPGGAQHPENSQGDCAESAEYEEEAVAKDAAGDGAEFIQEIDDCGEARGHLSDLGDGSTQTAAIVHQRPGNIEEGKCHR